MFESYYSIEKMSDEHGNYLRSVRDHVGYTSKDKVGKNPRTVISFLLIFGLAVILITIAFIDSSRQKDELFQGIHKEESSSVLGISISDTSSSIYDSTDTNQIELDHAYTVMI